ncbi:MAG: hypothetical protein ACE5G3_09640 [Gammaproteobacteria bacterium]
MTKMTNILLVLALAAGFISTGTHAADLLQSELDCEEILERWAADPASVPKHMVDECKSILGMASDTEVTPDVVPFAGAAQAADPCAGPNSGGSVHCWGPWSALAPAAGAAIGPQTLIPADEYEFRPELAEQFIPDLGSCQAGQPCGFATVVAGVTSQAPSDETTFAAFDLAVDGGSFVVAPGEPAEIASTANMSPGFIARPDEFENMRSTGADGDLRSRMIARVIRDTNGEITVAADIWAHGNAATRVSSSGHFAWGIAMSQPDLDFLKVSGVSAVFSGPMSVDNNTVATVTASFGSQSTWTGTWTNPGYSFDAGGSFIGADMLSDAGQFSANVVGPDSFVRGALLGQRDSKSIAHIIDVDLAGVGRIKDVGLLRE